MLKMRMVEAFLTNNAMLYGLLLQELKKNNIEFKTKEINMGTQNRRIGMAIGRFGENTNLEIMYYIYSYKKDVEVIKNIAYKIQRQMDIL